MSKLKGYGCLLMIPAILCVFLVALCAAYATGDIVAYAICRDYGICLFDLFRWGAVVVMALLIIGFAIETFS